jgi:phosphopantetheine adenylyltransferase
MAFKDYLKEAAEKHGVLSFGRMNPPTVGHEKVVNKVHEIAKAHNAEHRVVLSATHEPKKNPLSPAEKVKHAKRAFPGTNISAAGKGENFFHHAAKMHEAGVQHLHMVVGSDRKADTEKYLKAQNNKPGAHGHYNFKSITVHSSGERDPDSEGTAGISASKMRAHASSGNEQEFHAGLPSKMKPAHKKELYNAVRKGMGLNESETEADYGGEYYGAVQSFKQKAKEGPRKAVWVPAKHGTGGKYKVLPVSSLPPSKPVKSESTEPSYFRISNQIPVLLMTKKQLEEFFENHQQQLEFDGIQTKHFEMCPTAYKLFGEMIDTIRANKHIGEISGHQTKQPATQNSDAYTKVAAGIAVKPERLRQMQFKQYVGL